MLWNECLRLSSLRLLEITIRNISLKIAELNTEWITIITSIEDDPTIKDNIKCSIVEKVGELVDSKKYQLVQIKNSKWARDQLGLEAGRRGNAQPPPAPAPAPNRQKVVNHKQSRRRGKRYSRRPHTQGNTGQQFPFHIQNRQRKDMIAGLMDMLLK